MNTRFVTNMEPAEEKKIVDEIIKNRRLSYSIEILEVEGDKYTVRNNFGSTAIYIKNNSIHSASSSVLLTLKAINSPYSPS